jgi:xanthine dehydrogenase accessory factor
MLSYSLLEDNIELFVEVQHQPSTLIIVGAGHVALPLAKLAKMIDFDVVVLDDRPRFANKKRFPMADHVLAQPFTETLRNWPISEDTYIVLVTRGHTHDVECLLEVLDSSARYIGMIGSKRRVRAVFELLEREKGIDPAKFERVYSPIGLDIGAETPAEIAIAIMAEIINLYRGGRAISLSDALRADQRLPLHPRRAAKGKS